jgi:TatD DNase family protein
MPRTVVTDYAGLPRLHTGSELIDSHCHLDMQDFDEDRASVLDRASAVGVTTMVTIGAGGPPECNHAAIELAERHEQIFATVGIHPHDASIVDDEIIEMLRQLAAHDKVVAIGETGLDYHYDHSPRPQQQNAFRRFVVLAREVSLPLVVHLRAADGDAVEILRSERAGEVGGVIHCFSGNVESARSFLDLGFHLSFSGIVTFKTAGALREAVARCPLDRLMVETDSPYLAPEPHRGRRNRPALVTVVGGCVATVKGCEAAEVAVATWANAERVYGLPVAV